MLILNTLEGIKALALPASIQRALVSELLAPFAGDEQALNDFWHESGSVMYVITDDDPPDIIDKQEPIANLRLRMATEFPEYVLELRVENFSYLLALTIISDDGAGCYLLIKASHPSTVPDQLRSFL